jgi:IMP dehydrogenase
MVFYKDIQGHKEYPLESLDEQKRLLVGAGINSKDYKQRVPALIAEGVDILCLDSSDGFSEWQSEAIQWIKKTF